MSQEERPFPFLSTVLIAIDVIDSYYCLSYREFDYRVRHILNPIAILMMIIMRMPESPRSLPLGEFIHPI